jgi:hemolysin III
MSSGEEIANSVSHGLGFLAAIAWAPILVVSTVEAGSIAFLVGSCGFAATSVLLYLTSTLYHSLPRGRAKTLLQTLDHVAIFLLIAGTYTPFALGVLRESWGWTRFAMVWGLAAVGIALKAMGSLWNRRWSVALYVALGWVVLVFAKPVWEQVPTWGLLWLFGGGLAYTAGVYFYAATRIRYSQFVWHLFAMTGTGCHTVAVCFYAA